MFSGGRERVHSERNGLIYGLFLQAPEIQTFLRNTSAVENLLLPTDFAKN